MASNSSFEKFSAKEDSAGLETWGVEDAAPGSEPQYH